MSQRKKKLKVISSSSAGVSSVPDTEVRAIAKRRQFIAAYKLFVLPEADRLSDNFAKSLH